VLSPGLEHKLARHIHHRSTNGGAVPSDRERQVLELMADGLSSSAIGERLHLSESTVKTYVRRVYEKLGVSNRSAAIAEAMRRRILR
jgi:two-component system nitrate/nitrite response regulator NarL